MDTLNNLEFFSPSIKNMNKIIEKLESEYEDIVTQLKTSSDVENLHSHIQELQKMTQESLKKTQIEHSYLKDITHKEEHPYLYDIYNGYIQRISILLEEFNIIEKEYYINPHKTDIENYLRAKNNSNMH